MCSSDLVDYHQYGKVDPFVHPASAGSALTELLIIDEAERLTPMALELLRDQHDRTHLAIILVGKSAAAYAIVRSFGYRDQTAITISASLAQIGEFSFILAGLGVSAGLLPPQGRDLILAAAIISIFLNPLLFSFVTRQGVRPLRHAGPAEGSSEEPAPEQGPPPGHVIIVGYGRVGR